MGGLTVLGFGNRMWGDDGAGSCLAEALRGHDGVTAIDGGMVPENFLEQVAATQPETVLLVDAADFGGAPGEYRMVSTDSLARGGISSHAGSPRMLSRYLEARTGARVKWLVIQPEQTAEGQRLSFSVSRTVRELEEWLPKHAESLISA